VLAQRLGDEVLRLTALLDAHKRRCRSSPNDAADRVDEVSAVQYRREPIENVRRGAGRSPVEKFVPPEALASSQAATISVGG